MKRNSFSINPFVYFAVFMATLIAMIVAVTLVVKSCYASPSHKSIQEFCQYVLKNGKTVEGMKMAYIESIEPDDDGINKFYATVSFGVTSEGQLFVTRIDLIQEFWASKDGLDYVIQLIVSDMFADGLADMGSCGGMTFQNGMLLMDTRSPLSEQETERQFDRLFYRFFLKMGKVI